MDVNLKIKAFNPEVFHAYDIRGLYPEELDHNTIELSAKAFAQYLKNHQEGKICVISRDVRETSADILETVRDAISSSGLDVIDTGISTAPMFTFVLSKTKASGGIMVTASHNSIRYNGLKFYEETRALSEHSGLKEIKNIIFSGLLDHRQSRGRLVERKDFTTDYAKFLTSLVKIKSSARAVFDAGGGGAAGVLKEISKLLPVRPIFLGMKPDPSLSQREPDPSKELAQIRAKKKIIEESADVGFIYDPDGDRVSILDEKGALVRPDAILWLLADNFAERGDTIIADLRVSRSLAAKLEEKNIRIKKIRVGRSYISEAMRDEDAIFGCEFSGHFYFKEFFHADSAILATLKILEILSNKKEKLSELVKNYSSYFYAPEMNFEVRDKESLLSKLHEKYRDAGISYLDGLTAEYPSWWFNARVSNTENLLRLVIEANEEKIFTQKKAEIISFLESSGAKKIEN